MSDFITRMTHNLGQDAITCRIVGKYNYQLHYHDFYELQIILGGFGENYLNTKRYDMGRGHSFFVRLTDCHQMIGQDDIRRIVIQVHPECMPENFLRRFTLENGNLAANLGEDDVVHAEALAKLLISCCDGKYSEEEEMKQNLLQLIFGIFFNALSSERVIEKTSPKRFTEIILFIQDNFKRKLTVKEIAEKFYINHCYFCEYFKQNSGQTFSSYLRAVRLDYAVNLIIMTDQTTAEIASASGFNSLSHFLRCFKEKFKMTPTEMRNSRR